MGLFWTQFQEESLKINILLFSTSPTKFQYAFINTILQIASTSDLNRTLSLANNSKSHIIFSFLKQSHFEIIQSQFRPSFSSKRRSVNANRNTHQRLINLKTWNDLFRITLFNDCVSHHSFWHSGYHYNISCVCFVKIELWKNCFFYYFCYLSYFYQFLILVVHFYVFANNSLAGIDFAKYQFPMKSIGLSLRNKHRKWFFIANFRLRHFLNNSPQNTFNILSLMLQIFNRPPISPRTVVNRVVQERIRTIEIAKHLKDLVDNLTNSCSWPVYFIYHNQWLNFLFQSFSQHKFSLGHRSFRRTNYKANPINNIHNSLYLPTEILMPRRIHNVDTVIFVINTCAFGSESEIDYKIVMPFSLYNWFESIAHSSWNCTPENLSKESTKVVFPWSTWAMIATFLVFWRKVAGSRMGEREKGWRGCARREEKRRVEEARASRFNIV